MKYHPLIVKARKLLNSDNAPSLETVARATGLSYHWLQKFASGRIPDPGANRFLRLVDYLNAGGAQ